MLAAAGVWRTLRRPDNAAADATGSPTSRKPLGALIRRALQRCTTKALAPLHPMRRRYSATHGYMPLLAEGKWQRSLAMRVALLTLHEARLGAM
ncbi:hypothetical protein XFF4834R_chr16620 [Xanthomonas citri pv. fuscans]|nr:hypothetical protein XFF4834R_chr16620 [Xanthomonas citri pv. fuscans]